MTGKQPLSATVQFKLRASLLFRAGGEAEVTVREVVSTLLPDIHEGEYVSYIHVMGHISVRRQESTPMPAVSASTRCTGKF